MIKKTPHHANANQKKPILILDKIDFKAKSVTTDKEDQFIMKRVSSHQKDIIIFI